MNRKKSPQVAPVVLVTGGARRIGAVMVRYFHERGYRIVLHYNTSLDEATLLANELNEVRQDSVMLLQGDLTHVEQHQKWLEVIITRWGQLDVLVNNASVFYSTPFDDVNVQAWDAIFDANLKAPFFLSRAANPYLQQSKGCIVNVTDIHGERPMRDYSIYGMSKAGLIMMTKTLAKELGPNVRVNAVSPGLIMWPEGENTLTDPQKEKLISRTALKISGQPEDIARAVFYLADGGAYVTGQVLSVDGGRTL